MSVNWDWTEKVAETLKNNVMNLNIDNYIKESLMRIINQGISNSVYEHLVETKLSHEKVKSI